MIDEIIKDARERMDKSLHSLESAFNKIRTGRAHPGILDSVMVPYYGTDTPIQQMANVTIEDARTIAVSPWEKKLLPEIEKAILKSDLGLNPSNNGDVIRIPMPALTEETRKEYTKQAKQEAENARIAIPTSAAMPTATPRTCSRKRKFPRTKSAGQSSLSRN